MQDVGPDSDKYLIFKDFEGTLAQAHAGGARVHSDSWGSSTSGEYTGEDANVDRATRRLENLLVVIAAGNDQAGAMAVGSPANSKTASPWPHSVTPAISTRRAFPMMVRPPTAA